MPLMKLACTALERVPETRPKIIEHLMQKFPQDLVFCRAPGDTVLTTGVLGMLCSLVYMMQFLYGSLIVLNFFSYESIFL